MGAATSVYDRAGHLKPYPYPYSLRHKIAQFPFKFHLTNGKMHRLVLYGWVLGLFIEYEMKKVLRSQPNKDLWAEKRSHNSHTFFDPPAPPMFDRPLCNPGK